MPPGMAGTQSVSSSSAIPRGPQSSRPMFFDRTIEKTRDGVVGAVLISGGYVPHKGDDRYYGSDLDRNVPMAHVSDGKLPLLITMSEYDPPLLASDSPLFASALCKRDGFCPPFFWLSGHNHFSQVASLDTRDDRLGR